MSTSPGFVRCRRKGLPKFNSWNGQVCDACQLGKHNRFPFPNERNRSRNKLDLIHSDVWGPMQNMSIGGSHYVITFIEDYNWLTWVCLIEKKSEVFSCFLKVKRLAERKTGWKVKCLRIDGRKDYFSNQFSSYFQKEGIRHQFSYGYTPQHNGVAKRNNRTIEEAVRPMLEEKHMLKFIGSKPSGWRYTCRIRLLQIEECRHMSCTSGRSRIWHTWGYSVALHMCMCRRKSEGN
mgnify:CR=1 FL=1